jgi:hypothetical protein
LVARILALAIAYPLRIEVNTARIVEEAVTITEFNSHRENGRVLTVSSYAKRLGFSGKKVLSVRTLPLPRREVTPIQ